jgi:hypothetical protein
MCYDGPGDDVSDVSDGTFGVDGAGDDGEVFDSLEWASLISVGSDFVSPSDVWAASSSSSSISGQKI